MRIPSVRRERLPHRAADGKAYSGLPDAIKETP